MSQLHFQPIKGRAREILKAILQTPEVAPFGMKDILLLRLACEEIVMNVTSYAYPDDAEGYLNVEISKTDSRIAIRFEDGGKPFNPLEQKMPDTKLSWNRRRIGGLGVFLVIKKMDAVSYAYEDGKNVLTIEKNIKRFHENSQTDIRVG